VAPVAVQLLPARPLCRLRLPNRRLDRWRQQLDQAGRNGVHPGASPRQQSGILFNNQKQDRCAGGRMRHGGFFTTDASTRPKKRL
jgi:hypothetical protein